MPTLQIPVWNRVRYPHIWIMSSRIWYNVKGMTPSRIWKFFIHPIKRSMWIHSHMKRPFRVSSIPYHVTTVKYQKRKDWNEEPWYHHKDGLGLSKQTINQNTFPSLVWTLIGSWRMIGFSWAWVTFRTWAFTRVKTFRSVATTWRFGRIIWASWSLICDLVSRLQRHFCVMGLLRQQRSRVWCSWSCWMPCLPKHEQPVFFPTLWYTLCSIWLKSWTLHQ